MILVLTNADTEILALRCVIEDLPGGFPRCDFAHEEWDHNDGNHRRRNRRPAPIGQAGFSRSERSFN